MPPRIPRHAIALPNLPRTSVRLKTPSICLFCSQGPISRPRLSRQSQTHESQPRLRSNLTTEATTISSDATSSLNPRTELQDSLRDLQKHAGRFVNLSRLQLALHGLQQSPGDEAIRIAILGLADGGESLQRAKELLRLLLADPLKTEEEWERILLEDKQGGKPLLLRVGYDAQEGNTGGHLVRELYTSSPSFKGHKLEILVLEMDPPVDGGQEAFMESVLVPSMEIPTSNTGRYTPVTTPVHKCLIVGNGIVGATSLARFPIDVDRDIVGATANIQSLVNKEASLPFQVIDISTGADALGSFRESVENALIYEKEWFASGLPEIVEWIKTGTGPTEAEMKEPLRKLITSLLSRTSAAIEEEQVAKLNVALLDKVSSSDLQSLRKALSKWAENAHTELRDELDIAFDGNRWRKLSWWKLFWRVDDVSMIASDILHSRFLTDADKEIIFLSGRIAQVQGPKNIVDDPNWAYKPTQRMKREHKLGYEPPPPNLKALVNPRDFVIREKAEKPWPTHIPLTRSYLSLETVPALQALAQKLVLQTLTTSSLTSAVAGLMYVSTLSTSLYEAGAVAALGLVWSLRRMQGKWEAARRFWEGEVREEGRKAVRGVEVAISEALVEESVTVEVDQEVEKAREVLERAEDALGRCK